MLHLHARTAICLLIAAVAMFATIGSALAQEPDGFRDAIGLLDAWVNNRVASRGLPGLSIGVVLGDRLAWTRGYGYADLEKKTPATPQTLYGIRSMTKTFTAVAILQLRDAGKLHLDDPLLRHFSQVHIQRHSASAPDVTIRELLTHSSGLQRDVPGTQWTELIYPSEADLERPVKQLFEPDTQWYYSNLGFALLGKVVAVEAGQSWAAYVQERILTPLGMNRTRPIPRPDEPGLAVGYVRAAPGGTFVPVEEKLRGPTAVDPAGRIASDVEDLAKYLAFHMAEGNHAESPVLSGRTLREMHRPQWLLPDWQEAWGLGIDVRRVNGYVRVGHGGSGLGYSTDLQFIPALKLGVIVLTNSEEDDPGSYTDYAMQLLAPIISKSFPHENRELRAESKRFVGRYQMKKQLQIMLMTILDGKLSMMTPDEPNPYTGSTVLEPTDDPDVFVMHRPGEPSAGPFAEKVTFDLSSDGTVTGFHTENFRYSRIGPLASQ